jgi:lipoate-protein ligase A
VPESLRVIVEQEPHSGAWNMAVDEVLLETALASGQATLRWYRWSQPTLSLGHFQKPDDPAIEARFAALPRVRRPTGGGAILHDREWTYSVALGPEHALSADPRRLYRLIHETVIGVLTRFGIPAHLRGAGDLALDHHFLCFSRGDAHDVVIGPHKVLGSAQRRRRGAVLQHGALLLRASGHAPEFPGLFGLANTPPDEPQLLTALATATATSVSPTWHPGELAPHERQLAAERAVKHA